MASRQSAKSLWLVLSLSHVSWTWSDRCVVVNMLSDVGTENTYIMDDHTDFVQEVPRDLQCLPMILAIYVEEDASIRLDIPI